MRAYREGMTLAEPRFMDFIDEFDSPWSVTMATIWPNLIVQREMNTLGVRQIVPTGPHEFIMKWTMFGFEGDDEEMTRHRLRQGNLMGPAGFLGLEDNEAIKFVQDGMQHVPNGEHLVKLDPGGRGRHRGQSDLGSRRSAPCTSTGAPRWGFEHAGESRMSPTLACCAGHRFSPAKLCCCAMRSRPSTTDTRRRSTSSG